MLGQLAPSSRAQAAAQGARGRSAVARAQRDPQRDPLLVRVAQGEGARQLLAAPSPAGCAAAAQALVQPTGVSRAVVRPIRSAAVARGEIRVPQRRSARPCG